MLNGAKPNDSKFAGATTTCHIKSGVDLHHLRYAVAAEEHGSFRRAADALALRQSRLSRNIHQLEQRIDLILFERSSSGVRVTRAGRDFLRTARSILEQMDSLVRSAHRAGCGEAGKLAIGLFTSLSAGNFRATLQDFANRYPQIEIGMIERSRMQLLTALRNGTIDIAIVTGESPVVKVLTMPLWNERIVIALPEGHRLTANEAIHATELRGETLLMTRQDPGPAIQDLLTKRSAAPDDKPKIVQHDVSRGSIKCLVGAGFGISLMTESCIGANFNGLVYRVAHDDAGEIRIDYCAHWRGDNNNPALASFLRLLGERYSLPLDLS